MLKRMINQAFVDLTISPIDPLLIKSGQATVSGADMAFVKTYCRGNKSEPFIPGSSLKGVIRSYAEKICRSLRENPVPVCLPYVKPGDEKHGEKKQASCGLRITNFMKDNDKKNMSTSEVYRIACPACRMFGSHHFIGRLATSDGYLTEAFKKSPLLEPRDGVAIDRLTGGTAGGAKYDLEVLTRGEFGTRIEIHNFERWQLGLLGLVLRDMNDGLIRIGMGKSRGLGRIHSSVDAFHVTYFGKSQDQLKGLAAICPNDENQAYGFFQETQPGQPLPEPTKKGLRYEYDLTTTWQTDLEPAVQDLVAYIAQVSWPRDIEAYAARR